jgi:mono/diheme cytochrome c family protein
MAKSAAAALLIGLLAVVGLVAPVLAQEDEPPRMMTIPDRLAPPVLPDNPTQADLGAKVYYDYCLACHGDRGQGLTDEWRSAWAEGDQNCWQSRCHAASHPPDGFVLPSNIPGVIGDRRLAHYGDAANLHTYIQQRMPWHMPGSLSEEQYWQLTAYLARANGLYDESMVLTAASAASIHFQAVEQPMLAAEPSPDPSSSPSPPRTALIAAFLAATIAAIVAIGLLLRRYTTSRA